MKTLTRIPADDLGETPTSAQHKFLRRLHVEGRARVCFIPWWGIWNDGSKFRVPTLKACAKRGWIRKGAVVDDGFWTEVHLSMAGKKMMEGREGEKT